MFFPFFFIKQKFSKLKIAIRESLSRKIFSISPFAKVYLAKFLRFGFLLLLTMIIGKYGEVTFICFISLIYFITFLLKSVKEESAPYKKSNDEAHLCIYMPLMEIYPSRKPLKSL